MARDLSTAPSKPGERTRKFQQHKHLTSYWEVLGDKLRARKMNKEKKSKASGAEEEDRSHHGHTDGPLFFPQHSNNRETDDDDMVPPQLFRNAPNQAPQGAFFGQGQARSHHHHQQQQPQFHRMPTMADGRGLQSGEMEAHLQRGGQTEYGERPRGQGPSVYIDTEAPVPRRARSGGTPSRRQSQHPWEPETRHYEQERTRMR